MVDLHMHTTASDGRLSPTELLDEAKARGVSHLAITDHDTIDGYLSAREGAALFNPGRRGGVGGRFGYW